MHFTALSQQSSQSKADAAKNSLVQLTDVSTRVGDILTQRTSLQRVTSLSMRDLVGEKKPGMLPMSTGMQPRREKRSQNLLRGLDQSRQFSNEMGRERSRTPIACIPRAKQGT